MTTDIKAEKPNAKSIRKTELQKKSYKRECKMITEKKKEARNWEVGYYAIFAIWITIIPISTVISFGVWHYTLPYFEGASTRIPFITEVLFRINPIAVTLLVFFTIFLIVMCFFPKKLWTFITSFVIFLLSFVYLGVLIYASHIPFYRNIYIPRQGGWVWSYIDSTMHPPIVDGNIVLLKKGNSYGSIIFNDQKVGTSSPFATEFDYTCYYRNDNSGDFNTKDPKVHRENHHVSNPTGTRSSLSFGPFNFEYAPYYRGLGSIQYKYNSDVPLSKIDSDALRICITPKRDINNISATNPEWRYKASPTDIGVSVNKKSPADKPNQNPTKQR